MINRNIYKRNKKLSVYFDLKDNALDGGREAIQETWNELRYQLVNKEFFYNDDNLERKSRFLSVLNQLLEYENISESVTVDLRYFAKSKVFLRAVKIRSGETVTLSRFIPDASKMKSANRFSPKGTEWLYLGFDRYISDAKKCCFSEIRANVTDNVKYCVFKYIGENVKIIDLTIADKMEWDEISHKQKTKAELAVTHFLLETYCKLLSRDKEMEYAPFQCIAQYFKQKGYCGIIYKSTVCKYGKNLVVFDKNIFSPGEII